MGFARPSVAAVFLAVVTGGAAALAQHAFPDRIDPASAGWDATALAQALDYARAERATGFLIIEDGRAIAEENWPLGPDAAAFRRNFVHGTAADGALLEDVASQQKSFVAILVGVAIDRGCSTSRNRLPLTRAPGGRKPHPSRKPASPSATCCR